MFIYLWEKKQGKSSKQSEEWGLFSFYSSRFVLIIISFLCAMFSGTIKPAAATHYVTICEITLPLLVFLGFCEQCLWFWLCSCAFKSFKYVRYLKIKAFGCCLNKGKCMCLSVSWRLIIKPWSYHMLPRQWMHIHLFSVKPGRASLKCSAEFSCLSFVNSILSLIHLFQDSDSLHSGHWFHCIKWWVFPLPSPSSASICHLMCDCGISMNQSRGWSFSLIVIFCLCFLVKVFFIYWRFTR